MIVGIDEVGRGPWAGPLLVVALALHQDVPGLADSKMLSSTRRRELLPCIGEATLWQGAGWVSPDEIDRLGLSQALRLAAQRAVADMPDDVSSIIIDGTINLLAGTRWESRVTTMIKADQSVLSVSAASIVAKETRDAYMASMDSRFPGYGFADHAGYGTAKHKEAIQRLGVTPLHRLSFKPLHAYRDHPVETPHRNTPSGEAAERVVAEALQHQGYRIIERNWKTRWCEIDIIAEKDGVYWCVEVKHRHRDTNGTGFDAITDDKLRRMTRAAEMYAARSDHVVGIAVAETTGSPPMLRRLEFLE